MATDMKEVEQFLSEHGPTTEVKEFLRERDAAYPGMDYPSNLLAMVTQKVRINVTTADGSKEREHMFQTLVMGVRLFCLLTGIPEATFVSDLEHLEEASGKAISALREKFPNLSRADFTPEVYERLEFLGFPRDDVNKIGDEGGERVIH